MDIHRNLVHYMPMTSWPTLLRRSRKEVSEFLSKTIEKGKALIVQDLSAYKDPGSAKLEEFDYVLARNRDLEYWDKHNLWYCSSLGSVAAC